MKPFLNEDFLLENQTAQTLFHKYAKEMPIYDYHCHLNPQEIAQNKSYADLTELWLGGDHYKWRLMRACGIDESYITGDRPAKDKFIQWAKAISQAVGNPVYHWSHAELQRYFNITKPLNEQNAEAIWQEANGQLQKPEFSARGLITRSNVRALNTTDDPTDSLEWHQAIAKDGSFNVKVWPSFRPDKAINLHKESFQPWLKRLEELCGPLESFAALLKALESRIEHFHACGCRVSDHALDPVVYTQHTQAQADAAFKKAKKGEALSQEGIKAYQSALMLFLGGQYARRGWVMQLHLGVIRNASPRMFKLLGPDTGYDAIGDASFAADLAALLGALDAENSLPKTVLYSLNPRDNMVLATIAGALQGGARGKMQMGSAWWFNDHKTGMRQQLTDFANAGVLSVFIGMLTDSRSFISYPRHEYFRRILCNLIGEWAEKGELAYNEKTIGAMVQDICFNNVWNYAEAGRIN